MKILVIFTGGTIGCTLKNNVLKTDKSNSYLLLDMYNSFCQANNLEKVDFQIAQPYTILSENLSFDKLAKLKECINNHNLDCFDGIIVTHGTDTLQYTASYLSYVLGSDTKPIVLVSANYPLSHKLSNGLDNFVNAVNFIKSKNNKGVFVSYKNKGENGKIHRGTRLLPHLPYSDDIYSVLNSFYGEVVDNKFIKNNNYTEQKDEFNFDDKSSLTQDILKLNSYVGMNYPTPLENIKAILLEGYHSGTLNTSAIAMQKFCQNAQLNNIPVFLTGACKGFYYESKTLFDSLKIKVLPCASPIAMYIKLSLLKENELEKVYLPCCGDFVE